MSGLPLSLESLETVAAEVGLKPFHAKQIREWLFQRFVFDFHSMTNLPKAARDTLAQRFPSVLPEIKTELRSDDDVLKILIGLDDGILVEAVSIPEDDHTTFCLSTQAGCPVECTFCRTGTMGFKRNLTSEEILVQLLLLISRTGKKPTSVVFMGMGEPFLNIRPLFDAIDTLVDPKGLGMATRRVTISTVGIPSGIDKLAKRPGEVNLAISLHSADQSTRNKLIPSQARVPLLSLKKAVEAYIERTGRRVTFEVVLLDNVNDQPNDAMNLVTFCEGLMCHVNLLNYNTVPGTGFKPSRPAAEKEFRRILQKAGLSVTLRKSRGKSIMAGCGQLAGCE